MTTSICGGWTAFSAEISKEASDVFTSALAGLVGVSYSPVAVATQVVAGTNYSFFCNAKAAYPNAPETAALVKINKPLTGLPHITGIVPIIN